MDFCWSSKFDYFFSSKSLSLFLSKHSKHMHAQRTCIYLFRGRERPYLNFVSRQCKGPCYYISSPLAVITYHKIASSASSLWENLCQIKCVTIVFSPVLE